ncbi:MAG: hypothetical protein JST54_01335 [Deltaproteobacteria bacterium]|nr:hypothetical protein [Deltaproteobacteria bacterium]
MATPTEARIALAQKLAGLTGRKKVDALLDAQDPRALVRSLPAEDLYFTLKEVGLDDAQELVTLASPAQFRSFVDLDCWRREGLQPRAVLPWLRTALEGDDFAQKLKALDVEIVELLLRETVDVWDREEDPDREPLGHPWTSPEGRYVLDFKLEGEDLQALQRVVGTYYEEDPLQAVRFLEAVRWELPSELEETALRFRTGRMADLGFPELEHALKLYAYVDPDAALPTESSRPAEPPGFFLQSLGSRGFLDEALALLPADGPLRIDRELVYVFNGALVADGVEPGDLDGVRRQLAAARDHLALGLEYAAQGDAKRGAELLLTAPIARIFQVASGLTLKRKFRADRLVQGGFAGFPGAKNTSWFDAPLGAAIEGLRRKRPQLAVALEREGGGHELRPFRSRKDLALVDAALERAEALAQLAQRLGLDASQAERAAKAARAELYADVRLSELVIHLALQGRGKPVEALVPFKPKAVVDAASWALVGDKASPELERALRQALAGAARTDVEKQMARELGDYAMVRASEELGVLRGEAAPEAALLAGLPLLVSPG